MVDQDLLVVGVVDMGKAPCVPPFGWGCFFILGLASTEASPVPPPWPKQWMQKGFQVNAFPLPPWEQQIPVPSVVTPFQAYYDWDLANLREDYQESCVPIFQNGSMWSCSFLNVNKTSFLLQYEDRPKGQPQCCVFERPWNPPAPDFGKALFFFKNTTGPKGENIMWWQSHGVTPSEGGPFGYGWSTNSNGTPTPYAFYFGGLWNYANGTVGGSNIIQYFEGFSDNKPPSTTWDVPESCNAAVQCNNF
jgi:hypothetical protein